MLTCPTEGGMDFAEFVSTNYTFQLTLLQQITLIVLINNTKTLFSAALTVNKKQNCSHLYAV